jgi:hypothetical protein
VILVPQDVLVLLVKAVLDPLALQVQLDLGPQAQQDPADLLAYRVYKDLPVSKDHKDLQAQMVKLVLLAHWADHLVLQEIPVLQVRQDQLAKQEVLVQLDQQALQVRLVLQELQVLLVLQELQVLLDPRPLAPLAPQVKQGLLALLGLLDQK